MGRDIIIILSAFLAAGCSALEPIDIQKDDAPSKVFRVGLGEVVDTRTYVDGDLHHYWREDDRVSIFTSTLNEQYKFDGQTGEDSGTISKVGSGQSGTGSAIPSNYAVYPYNASTTISSRGVVTLTLPSTQSYAEGTFGQGANTMVAVTRNSGDDFLAFKNVGGYIVLKLYGGGTVKSITISGNNGEKIAGKASVSISYGGSPSVTMGTTATETITLDCGNGVTLGATKDQATSFWFSVPPVTFSKGFTITAVNTKGMTMTKSSSKSRTVTRNVVNSVPVKAEFKRPVKLPIEYVAEYNLANAKTFSTDHLTHGWFMAEKQFNYPYLEQIKVNGYHIPTIYEWNGVIPASSSNKISIGSDVIEQLFTSEYKVVGEVNYAKRFIGTDYESAYRYELIGGNVIITVRYLGKDSGVSLNTIASETWWISDDSEDISRTIPAAGYYATSSTPTITNAGTRAHYWSSTDVPSSNPASHHAASFTATTKYDQRAANWCRLPVRLFED